jgi:hypothetical protein
VLNGEGGLVEVRERERGHLFMIQASSAFGVPTKQLIDVDIDKRSLSASWAQVGMFYLQICLET